MDVIMPPTMGAAIGFMTSSQRLIPTKWELDWREQRTPSLILASDGGQPLRLRRLRCLRDAALHRNLAAGSVRRAGTHNHHHAGFNGNAEQSDIANPDGDTEVVSEELLQNEAAC